MHPARGGHGHRRGIHVLGCCLDDEREDRERKHSETNKSQFQMSHWRTLLRETGRVLAVQRLQYPAAGLAASAQRDELPRPHPLVRTKGMIPKQKAPLGGVRPRGLSRTRACPFGFKAVSELQPTPGPRLPLPFDSHGSAKSGVLLSVASLSVKRNFRQWYHDMMGLDLRHARRPLW